MQTVANSFDTIKENQESIESSARLHEHKAEADLGLLQLPR